MMLFSTLFAGFACTITAAAVPAPVSSYLDAMNTDINELQRRTDNLGTCANKNPAVVNVVGQFCQKKDIVVPSRYAATHIMPESKILHNLLNSTVEITYSEKCQRERPYNGAPAVEEWVPQEYCISQFYEMCAEGDLHGYANRNYGNCQYWSIMACDTPLCQQNY